MGLNFGSYPQNFEAKTLQKHKYHPVSQVSPKWNLLLAHLEKVYHTMKQFQVEVPNYHYAYA